MAFSTFVRLAILVHCAALGACTTATGDLFSRPAQGGSGGATCQNVAPLSLAEGDDAGLFAVAPVAGGWGLTYHLADTSFFLALDADGTASGSPTELGDIASVGDPTVIGVNDEAKIAFHNHALAGSWRVYLSQFQPSSPVLWDELTTLPRLEAETMDPQVSVFGERLGVAFRDGSSVVLVTYDSLGNLVQDARGESANPPPDLRSTVATEIGWTVLHFRSAFGLTRFDGQGAILGTLETDFQVAALVANGAAHSLIGSADGQFIKRDWTGTSLVPTSETAVAAPGAPVALAAAPFGPSILLGWLDGEGRLTWGLWTGDELDLLGSAEVRADGSSRILLAADGNKAHFLVDVPADGGRRLLSVRACGVPSN